MNPDDADDRRYSMPPTAINDLRSALASVGIKAEVERDETGQNLITMTSAQFKQRRAWIEQWFTAIAVSGGSVYLRERPRATGDTV